MSSTTTLLRRRGIRLPVLISFAIFVSASAWAQQRATGNAAIEQALRDLDAKWSSAAQARNIDQVVSYYADGAVVMAPNAPSATTKEAIQNGWQELLGDTGNSTSWKPTKVEVAQSGEIAYTSGTYEDTIKDGSGKTTQDRGKYLAVWKKQSDGSWKVIADIWNSDLPATTPPEEE